MRVGFVAEQAEACSGWGRYAVEVVRAVRDRGIEPVLITARSGLDATLRPIEQHVLLPPILTRRVETLRSLFVWRRLTRLLSTCDLVHGIAEPYMPLIALSCRRRQPYVQTAHGTWAVRPFRSARRALFGPALRRVNLLVCQSRFTRDALGSLVGLPPHVVLSGGVRAEDFERAPDVVLPDWARNAAVVLCVGSVKPRKGIHVALEAASIARRTHPDLHLVVVGSCDEHSTYVRRLRERADAIGMHDAFHLMGALSPAALVAWYHAAELFILLPVTTADGSFEGLGLVYLEAGASGLPSIGTRRCGAEDAIADEETGLLVPQDDAGAAAGALDRLLSDAALRARMSAAARERSQRFSWACLAEALTRHYQELARGEAAVVSSQPAGTSKS
jgi:glycosyltransferase involved in cell wall biosynthesis